MKEGENLVSWSVFLSHTNLDVPRGLRTLFLRSLYLFSKWPRGQGSTSGSWSQLDS